MLEVVGRGVGGRAAWLAALVLVVSGCAGPGQSAESPSPLGSPSPSPSPLPLAIISATFHNGEVGIDYAPVTLVASGGVSPYSWKVAAGAMPAGLTISENGTLGGTPKAAGTFRFTLQVTDSAGGMKAGGAIYLGAMSPITVTENQIADDFIIVVAVDDPDDTDPDGKATPS